MSEKLVHKIWVVDDSLEYLNVISFGLNDEDDLEVSGQYTVAESALRDLQGSKNDQKPDLLLLDLNLPGISGLDAIAGFKSEAALMEIIVLTESEDRDDILKAVRKGAVGYLLKSASLAEISSGIRTVMAGGTSLDPYMSRHLLPSGMTVCDSAKDSLLSARELEIIQLLANGSVHKQIAAQLNISPKTVDYHLGNAYKKLDVGNAPAAVAKAYRLGVLC